MNLETKEPDSEVSNNPPGEGSAKAPAFSIIVTCFQEVDNIVTFHAQLSAALKSLAIDAEVVYVNDGSYDGTLQHLAQIFDEDPLVSHVIDLANNAGQTNAQTAGVVAARGKDFIFIDCDLQLDPRDLKPLVDRFEAGYDMVGGYRVRRHDPGIRVLISKIGNIIISRILGKKIRDMGCTFKVINGELLRAFELGPYRPMDPGELILSIRDFDEIPVVHKPRVSGRSRWTAGRMLSLYYNIFSNLAPVIFPFFVGVMVMFLVMFLIYLVAVGLFPNAIPWTASPLITPGLVGLNMLLNLVFFLFLGEFSLITKRSSKSPAYVVRKCWKRTA